MNVIEVEHLVKSYKNVMAVNDVSFTVKQGQIFGLLGPNGAGKTTTIECIIGLQKRDSGRIQVLGCDPSHDSRQLYRQIGVQLQEASYQDKVKVSELCELFSSLYEDPLDYRELLEKFHLSDKTHAYVSNLSGGQRQKVSIVLALISNPKLLFLDELTTGLDPNSRREMWNYLKELRDEGRTIFMTTHYMEEAAFLCDQICIIDEGKIIANDTVDGVIDQANLGFTITFRTESDISRQIIQAFNEILSVSHHHNTLTIEATDESLIPDILLFLRDHRIPFRKLSIKQPDLEDAYIRLTGKEWGGESK